MLNAQVDEARTGDFDRRDEAFGLRVLLQSFDQRSGDFSRVLLQLTRELHGGRTGDVAVFGALRTFEGDRSVFDADRGEGFFDESLKSNFLLREHGGRFSVVGRRLKCIGCHTTAPLRAERRGFRKCFGPSFF